MKTKELINQANEMLPFAGKEMTEILKILIKRWTEMEEGKNYGTYCPVYCVYTLSIH